MMIKNRKAYHEFTVLADFECGLILTGSEVKSIRGGDVTIGDSFAYFKVGEIFVKNMKVAPYKQAHKVEKHDENREKKLLLKKKEIAKIDRMMEEKGTTMVLLDIHLSNNRIKAKIGVCKGKKLWNKREDIKKRDIDRDTKREISQR
jgi:SsrA-binding protein